MAPATFMLRGGAGASFPANPLHSGTWLRYRSGHSAMTDEIQSLVLPMLRDIQARLARMESRMTNIELRMTAQEQHLGALLTSLPAHQDRTDELTRRVERIERRLDLVDSV
jgi:hypothetical protein